MQSWHNDPTYYTNNTGLNVSWSKYLKTRFNVSRSKHLKTRFKPVDIEELKSVEFHQKMQGQSASVKELGISLQKLATNAFPVSKWQRKLDAPKSGEMFSELYDRACTLEQHDKQFSEVAESVQKTMANEDKQKETPSPVRCERSRENSRATQRFDNSTIRQFEQP